MTERVEFFVHGTPAPQGSHSAMKRGDRAIIVPSSSTSGRLKHAAWRNAVSQAALSQGAYFDEPVKVLFEFFFAPVKSDPYRYFHTSTPDADKIARSTGDSLVAAGILRDDSLICELFVLKLYAAPGEPTGCRIVITGMGGDEKVWRDMAKKRAKALRKKLRA